MNDRDSSIFWARDILAAGEAVILDTETTGLQSKAEIVQVAVINLKGSTLLNSLVKPIDPIPEEAIVIHGITNEMVKDAPPWSLVFPRLQELTENKPVIIYNASFDLRMIYQSCNRYRQILRVTYAPRMIHDAMIRYSAYFGEWSNSKRDYKWQPLTGGDHSALGDCLATLSRIQKMAAAPTATEKQRTAQAHLW